jgi:hypothetical protein
MASFTEIVFASIKSEINRYLTITHNKASLLYSPASPYGQILDVLSSLHQLSFLYLKNSINQFDLISDPENLNDVVIRNAAILAGHIPGRAISASGNLKLTVKSGVELDKVLPGNKVTFNNRFFLKNKTNGLDYALNLGQETITYAVSPSTVIYMPIIQGKFDVQNFTGSGAINQSYSVTTRGITDIENFNVEVQVNGTFWTIKKHIYEMLPNEEAVVVRSGFNLGMDVIFGNGGFGAIPPIGSNIVVTFLTTNGEDGNIFRRTFNDWKFVDEATDGVGGQVDPAKIFDVAIYNDINFGVNREKIKFTRNILPIVSNNFVLGLPQQYAYAVKRLGVFSHVNAYEDSGTIYIVCTPNINLFKNQNSDYFTVNIRAFELDNYEKSKIDKYLKTNGHIQLTRSYRIDAPVLSYYVMNVFVIRYSDSNDESVQSEIINKVSEYFLNFSRMDRVPKSDLVKVLASINSIHSVDVQFISKNNEDYHKEEIRRQQAARRATSNFDINVQTRSRRVSVLSSELEPVVSDVDYSNNTVLGIDPILGDIIFEPQEIPVIRGGWYDRNDIYFSDELSGTGLKSINIIKKGVVDSSLRNNTL